MNIEVTKAGIFDFGKAKKIEIDNPDNFDSPAFRSIKTFLFHVLHPHHDIFFVMSDNLVIGAAIKNNDRIDSFTINPEYRGHVFGGCLMVWLLDNVFNGATVLVSKKNTRAIKFYEKNGFRKSGYIMEVGGDE